MKKIILCVVLLVIVTVFSGTLSSCGANRETLNLFNWGAYMSQGDDGLMDVVGEFEKEFGIKVNEQYFDSNEQMYSKLISGSAEFDLLIPSEYMIARLIEEDRLEPLNFAAIPNYEYIDDAYKGSTWGYDSEDKYSVPYTWGLVGLAYNTKQITEPVDSWDMLWNEKYKDKILMFFNPRDCFGIAQKRLGYSMNSTSRDELDAAAEELKKQRPLVSAYIQDEMMEKMISGESYLTPCFAGDGVTIMDSNEDVNVVFPKEGYNIFVDAMVIPKGAKNKANAEKFINFINRPEVALNNILYIQYSTPHTEAYKNLPEEIKSNKIIYPDGETIARAEGFKHLPKETSDYMDDLWQEIKFGN
ncbi:MAG: spermidine/putrescine ABC transporter substrate-binding protein [Oscillospiraceae bacterium]|nr:spermidine/putrescine ABC transporter substrate-binding protein [Oscillospiraceae bacterium]